MDFRKSGRVPGLWLITAVLLAYMLTGCNVTETQPSDSINSPPSSEEQSEPDFSSTDSDCHVPTIDNSGAPSDDTSSDSYDSDYSDSNDLESWEFSDNRSDPDIEEPSSLDYPESSVSSETPISSEIPDSSSVSHPVSSTSTVSSSSENESSSEVGNIPVVIPQIAVPSSPGTATASADHGVLDYSNASEGYISVKYTGDKAKAKIRIIYGDVIYDHNVDVDGSVVYYPLSCGSGEYTAMLYENTTGNKYTLVFQETFYADIKRSTSPFSYPNRYVNYNLNSDVVYKAAELCAGKNDTIDKIAAVFLWVTDNIKYDRDLAASVTSGYVPDPDRTLSRMKGICFDYASLTAAMLRSQSIPTRLVIGYASPDIYHAWNEVYTEETGWITPVLLLKNKGYNLVDATFYAGVNDKDKAAEYISNPSNYSAIYYY